MRITQALGTAIRAAHTRLFGRRYPVSVIFVSTYRCNFSCEYCDLWRLRDGEMDTGEALSMIDEFSSIGARSFTFAGGEPLLREDIGELIRHCGKRGITANLFTNGSLLSARKDVLDGVDKVTISLDGPKHVHEAQRMRGSFDSVIAGMNAAKKAGKKVVLHAVVTRKNAAHLGTLVKYAGMEGVKLTFEPVADYPFAAIPSTIESLRAGESEYAEAVLRLRELVNQGRFNAADAFEENRECSSGSFSCAVSPTGEVSPCFPLLTLRHWPSGRELGFRNAFMKLERSGCSVCSIHFKPAQRHGALAVYLMDRFGRALQKPADLTP